ncbi:MAG: hypothetical protein ACI9RZ_001810, partial [Sphingobacteriales bacterium]
CFSAHQGFKGFKGFIPRSIEVNQTNLNLKFANQTS